MVCLIASSSSISIAFIHAFMKGKEPRQTGKVPLSLKDLCACGCVCVQKLAQATKVLFFAFAAATTAAVWTLDTALRSLGRTDCDVHCRLALYLSGSCRIKDKNDCRVPHPFRSHTHFVWPCPKVKSCSYKWAANKMPKTVNKQTCIIDIFKLSRDEKQVIWSFCFFQRAQIYQQSTYFKSINIALSRLQTELPALLPGANSHIPRQTGSKKPIKGREENQSRV